MSITAEDASLGFELWLFLDSKDYILSKLRAREIDGTHFYALLEID